MPNETLIKIIYKFSGSEWFKLLDIRKDNFILTKIISFPDDLFYCLIINIFINYSNHINIWMLMLRNVKHIFLQRILNLPDKYFFELIKKLNIDDEFISLFISNCDDLKQRIRSLDNEYLTQLDMRLLRGGSKNSYKLHKYKIKMQHINDPQKYSLYKQKYLYYKNN